MSGCQFLPFNVRAREPARDRCEVAGWAAAEDEPETELTTLACSPAAVALNCVRVR